MAVARAVYSLDFVWVWHLYGRAPQQFLISSSYPFEILATLFVSFAWCASRRGRSGRGSPSSRGFGESVPARFDKGLLPCAPSPQPRARPRTWVTRAHVAVACRRDVVTMRKKSRCMGCLTRNRILFLVGAVLLGTELAGASLRGLWKGSGAVETTSGAVVRAQRSTAVGGSDGWDA